jgi:hypothetical protein
LEENREIDVREVEWDRKEWIYFPQDRVQWSVLVNKILDLLFTQNIAKHLDT